MNAITTVPPPLAYGDIERLADAIAKSNLFGIKTKEQALVLMMIARSEGRDPVEAARDYDIIQGKPAKKAEAMLRDFLVAGGKVEWHELSDAKADATFIHPQTGKVRIDWDLARANTAGFGGKDMWKKFPRQMLRSRVVSEGVRTLWPLATSGMYVPEEQADIPAHNGPTIESTVTDAREAINTEVPMKAAAATTPRPERKVDPKVYDAAPADPLDEPDGRRWLVNLETALANAQSQDEVVQIGGHPTVGNAAANAPPAVKTRISELLAAAYGRFAEPDLSDEALGEVEIAGMDKVGAG